MLNEANGANALPRLFHTGRIIGIEATAVWDPRKPYRRQPAPDS